MKYRFLNENGIVFFQTDDRDKAMSRAAILTARDIMSKLVDNDIDYEIYTQYFDNVQRDYSIIIVINPEEENDEYHSTVKFNGIDLKNPTFDGFDNDDIDEFNTNARNIIDVVRTREFVKCGVDIDTRNPLLSEPPVPPELQTYQVGLSGQEVKKFRFNIGMMVMFASGFLSALLLTALW